MKTNNINQRFRNFRPESFTSPITGGHLQTIGGWLFRQFNSIEYRRRRLELSDGDFLDLDIFPPGDNPQKNGDWRAVAILIHGLEGSSQSGYIKKLAQFLGDKRIKVIAMNMRCCGGELNRKNRFYSAKDSGDLKEVVNWCEKNYPEKPLLGVGFSLGGALLLKYLGEAADNSSLSAAVGVSVPLDLDLGVRQIESGFSKIYNKFFTYFLRKKARRKQGSSGYHLPVEEVDELNDLRKFDDRLTAPLCGFQDAEDYYESCSSTNFIEKIKVSTMLIQAESDPMAVLNRPVKKEIKRSAYVRLINPSHGGHVGFWETKFPVGVKFWVERQIALYFDYLLAG
ncbi:MAG: YheT family hydrolase [bacterium]